jgi:NADH-quinone oxidoreductase subunit I
MNVTQLIKSFTLWEFLKAHWLTLQYFCKPRATITDRHVRSIAWAW